MILAVASGKGGTGKTTVAVGIARSVENAQYVDCDVEEPNGHLFLRPTVERRLPVTIPIPRVDEDRCTHCGVCAEVCEFNAIAVFPNLVMVFDGLCRGCGACKELCPEKAVREEDHVIGLLEFGHAGRLDFLQGVLNPGEPVAAPVIRRLKKELDPDRTVILDAPPGTGCPVVETVRASDFCILVTEPTPFGLHDLKLAVEMLRELHVPYGVVINKSGLGDEGVRRYCEAEHIPVLLRIPFDRRIAEAYSRGRSLVEAVPEYAEKFRRLVTEIRETAAAGD